MLPLGVLSKKIIAIQLLSLVCFTNLVGCPCSNVVNTLVWWFFTRRWIIFWLFLWITSQFHHGILEPPTKINLCHCQFVLMSSNIHFFLGPLPIGIPSHWLFVSCSRFSPSTGLSRTRHPPTVADYHDTPAVTGGLHPLLDIAPKNRRVMLRYYVIAAAMLNTSGEIFCRRRILCNWAKGIVSKLFGFRELMTLSQTP